MTATISDVWRWRCDLCGTGGMTHASAPDPFVVHHATRRHRFTAKLPKFIQRLLLKLHSA